MTDIGRLRLVRYTREGELVVFQVVRAGESFAESDLFSEVYSCDAIAEVQSRVIVYPKQLLLTVIRDQPDLTFTGEGEVGNITPEAGLNPQAEARSWQTMLNFFEEVLQA